MKNTWTFLNEVINGKMKQRNFISHFNYNNNEIYKQEIANGFNEFLLILAQSWQIELLFQKIMMYFNI